MAYTDAGHEQDLIAWEQDFRDRGESFEGDARRCPRHPQVKTSSDNGLFDGLCGLCEQQADDDALQAEYEALEATGQLVPQAALLAEAAPQEAWADDDIPF